MKVLDILNRLEEISSTNEKVEFLKSQAESKDLKKVLHLALDPYIQFYQRKIPLYSVNKKGTDNLRTGLKKLLELSIRTVTGNNAIRFLQSTLEDQADVDDVEVIARVVLKDLKCGVAAGLVNKAFPGLISEYSVMLCTAMNLSKIKKMEYPVMVQEKCDGARVNVSVEGGEVLFKTRAGRTLDLSLNPELIEDFKTMANGVDVVYDGEILITGAAGGVEPRKVGNGIIAKAIKGTIKAAEAQRVTVYLWDRIPINEVNIGRGTESYEVRHNKLEMDWGRSGRIPSSIHMVHTITANSFDEVEEFYNAQLEKGHEGAVVKSKSGVWSPTRVPYQIKMKAELDCDLRIIGFKEGTGQFMGSLGSLICQSGDGVITVSVGSGFTPAQRANFWARREELRSGIAEVKYNCRITDEKGNQSLFLPIFIDIRTDKFVADISENIK